MTKRRSNDGTPTITRLEDDREYRALRDRLNSLCQQRDEDERVIGADVSQGAERRESLREQAERIARGEDEAATAVAAPPPDELERAHGRRLKLRAAIELVQKDLRDRAWQLSLQACADAAPQYVEHLGRIAAAVRELAEARDAMVAYCRELDSKGYSTSPLPAPAIPAGWSLSTETSVANAILADIAKAKADTERLAKEHR